MMFPDTGGIGERSHGPVGIRFNEELRSQGSVVGKPFGVTEVNGFDGGFRPLSC